MEVREDVEQLSDDGLDLFLGEAVRREDLLEVLAVDESLDQEEALAEPLAFPHVRDVPGNPRMVELRQDGALPLDHLERLRIAHEPEIESLHDDDLLARRVRRPVADPGAASAELVLETVAAADERRAPADRAGLGLRPGAAARTDHRVR